ncbi:GNAT family N-acetyltransferase [uncultured Clostridium sp.]|uniref:GNAT family N-acetyltransferase n=1 Tax=uncultured Clostridium sp. TaxID=59620 RepID=UPI0025F7040B|nr:GNAT family N-acetyltransferase [uncultured Clostridium sp.]
MLDLKFQLAKKSDLDKIFEMYTDAIKEMEKNNIHQWDELYPDKEILEEDIEKQEMYLAFDDDKVVAAYVLNEVCDEEYLDGEWKFPDASFSVIHRLCVNPKYQRCGVGSKTVKYIEDKVKLKGIESIRLDTFTLNPYSLRMYDKLGYKKVGMVHWRKGDFYLMEKRL